MPLLLTSVLVGATVTTGLTAGLLYSFGHCVMPGLGALDDRAFLTAFGRIDAAISNPWMGLAWAGSPILVLAAVALRVQHRDAAFWCLVAAAGLVVATNVITGVVHLPLNAAVQDAAPAFTDAAALRERFEARWVEWNVVRTVTSVAATGLLGAALALVGRTSS
jgi:uncharacterized membrane protein